jgi:hypothetical protein
VQHERVGVGAEIGNDEGDLVLHQTRDEMHIAAQPIQLRYNDRRFRLASRI